jgi:hypothetical protein
MALDFVACDRGQLLLMPPSLVESPCAPGSRRGPRRAHPLQRDAADARAMLAARPGRRAVRLRASDRRRRSVAQRRAEVIHAANIRCLALDGRCRQDRGPPSVTRTGCCNLTRGSGVPSRWSDDLSRSAATSGTPEAATTPAPAAKQVRVHRRLSPSSPRVRPRRVHSRRSRRPPGQTSSARLLAPRRGGVSVRVRSRDRISVRPRNAPGGSGADGSAPAARAGAWRSALRRRARACGRDRSAGRTDGGGCSAAARR